MTRPPQITEIADREQGSRHLSGWTGRLVTLLALGWSLLQLAVATVWDVSTEVIRAFHLAFALALVFLSFPALRSPRLLARLRGRWGFLSATHRLPWSDLLCAVLAIPAAMYLILDYEGIGSRLSNPLPRDLIMGVLLVLLLLDAARRALGPALPTVGLVFILYSLSSEWMPGVLATRATSLPALVQKLSLGTGGIYGIPLDVSANTVFLFVLFGALLNRAGGGRYFIDLAISLLGGFRGGPAKASVLASGLTGMINGSSIANTVTTGTFTIPLMKKAGYPAVKAGAIEVAASTNGQLMPPIMGAAAFIIAEYCNLPYAQVVRAAILPALISYLALLYITHLEAHKLALPRIPRHELPRFLPTLLSGLHFLIPLGVLLALLLWEQRSPRLSAAYAILTLAVVIVLRELVSDYRKGVTKALPMIGQGLVDGAKGMMGIGVAVAAAGIIVGVVQLGLSSQVTQVIAALSGGSLMGMLLVTAVVSLILGMGLPTTANYIVMATLTVAAIETLAKSFGFEVPLIAIHLFCFYFGILSDDTPPVGLSAYAASAISGADPVKTGIQGFTYDIRTAILPFMFIFNERLLLIGVHGPLEILLVFASALTAMFAFASATQGWLLRRNHWLETVLLLAVSFALFRPDAMQVLYPMSTLWWKLAAVTLYAGLIARQALTRRV